MCSCYRWIYSKSNEYHHHQHSSIEVEFSEILHVSRTPKIPDPSLCQLLTFTKFIYLHSIYLHSYRLHHNGQTSPSKLLGSIQARPRYPRRWSAKLPGDLTGRYRCCALDFWYLFAVTLGRVDDRGHWERQRQGTCREEGKGGVGGVCCTRWSSICFFHVSSRFPMNLIPCVQV